MSDDFWWYKVLCIYCIYVYVVFIYLFKQAYVVATFLDGFMCAYINTYITKACRLLYSSFDSILLKLNIWLSYIVSICHVGT